MRQILVIDDDEADRGLIAKALEHFPSGAEITPVCTFEEGLAKARKALFDIIILDANLHGSEQRDTPARIQMLNPKSSAVIILTGYRDEGLILEAMSAGASRYMEKAVLTHPEEFKAQVATTFYSFRARREKEFSLGGADSKISNEEIARMVCESGLEASTGRMEIKQEVAAVAVIATEAKDSAQKTETLFRELNGRVSKNASAIAVLQQTNWDRFVQFSTAHFRVLSWKQLAALGGGLWAIMEAALQARDIIRGLVGFLWTGLRHLFHF